MAASSAAWGSVVLAFDFYAPHMSDAFGERWHYDVYDATGIGIGRDIALIAGIVVVTTAGTALIYTLVKPARDVVNYSGLDLARENAGRGPKRPVPSADLQGFCRAAVIGGWLGALGTALYFFIAREIEPLAYGPIIGFLFGSLLYPGIANFVKVNRRNG